MIQLGQAHAILSIQEVEDSLHFKVSSEELDIRVQTSAKGKRGLIEFIESLKTDKSWWKTSSTWESVGGRVKLSFKLDSNLYIRISPTMNDSTTWAFQSEIHFTKEQVEKSLQNIKEKV